MEIKINRITATPRSKYYKYLSGGSSGSSSSGGSASIDTNNFVKKTGELSQTVAGDFIVNGNVGIGTSEPQYKLDVNGTTRISDKLYLDRNNVNNTIVFRNNGIDKVSLGYEYTQSGFTFYNFTSTKNLFIADNGDLRYDNFIVKSSGNVGIGTISPQFKLDVNGTGKFTNVLTGYNWSAKTSGYHCGVDGDKNGISFYDGVTTVSAQIYRGSDSNLYVGARGGTANLGIIVDSVGNVGISNSSPSYKLDVNGTTRIFGGLHLNSEGWLNLYNAANTSRISISHNSASSKLDIYNRTTSTYADIQTGNITTYTINMLNDQTERFIRSNVYGGAIRLRGNSASASDRGIRFGRVDNSLGWSSQMAINADSGNVMIGTTKDAGYKLDVNGNTRVTGNLLATGEITAYSASDIRLKTNIKPIMSAIDVINKLNPVSYNWNDKAKELNPLKGDLTEYGLIAQELEEVLPELVHPIYDGEYKSIDYVKIVPLLIGAIKELQLEINELKNK